MKPDRPGQIAEAVLGALRQVLAGASDVRFAYLFGSIAKGRPRESSDVDVAVSLDAADAAARQDRVFALEAELERLVGRTVQVVVLDDAPLELRRTVLGHGILAHTADDAARRRFFVDTGRHYYDMAPARAIFARYQRRRIREGTFGG
ncbi:MAG TPA: nucleotidyltransferase domain-containing protein [Longimicrobiales bacterium]|nr:nucleotidyltransferase domain-containing protein [Longimicrobiales bacterium]